MKIHHTIWGMMLVLLLMACKEEQHGDVPTDEDFYLTIYVYSPGKPIVTRSDVQYQAATDAENAIHKLQLWAFRHDGGELVGYLEEENVSLSEGGTFKMLVSREFADSPVNVDVYALANVSTGNTGCSFSRTTPRNTLDVAQLKDSYFFGTNAASLEQNVPAEGLPMTGILKDQPVVGSYPALRVGTIDAMATVQLVRSVSKIRFLIVRGHDENDPEGQLHTINSITLDGGMIPQEEYLLLTEPHDNSLNPANPLGSSRIHIGDSYESSEILFGSPSTEDIPVVDPDSWEYGAEGAEDPLSFSITYLRESDRQLMGSITYTREGDTSTERTATFVLSNEGDFSRNHSWTVLVVFVGGNIQIFNVVDIGVARWGNGGSGSHDEYNW